MGKFQRPALLLEWGISLKEYTEGGWGNVQGLRAKFPLKTLRAFADNGMIDFEKLFNECAVIAIEYVINAVPFLQDPGIKFIKESKDRTYIRRAVYSAIQFNLENDAFKERVAPMSVNSSSYSYTEQASTFVFSRDSLGFKANTILDSHIIGKYEVFEDVSAAIKKTGGRFEFIAFQDLDDIESHKENKYLTATNLFADYYTDNTLLGDALEALYDQAILNITNDSKIAIADKDIAMQDFIRDSITEKIVPLLNSDTHTNVVIEALIGNLKSTMTQTDFDNFKTALKTNIDNI